MPSTESGPFPHNHNQGILTVAPNVSLIFHDLLSHLLSQNATTIYPLISSLPLPSCFLLLLLFKMIIVSFFISLYPKELYIHHFFLNIGLPISLTHATKKIKCILDSLAHES
eukprot:TRINITY_DN9239_c0_g1_i11.p1 TRINITY_DN9239_c0_g1~~TRINITY_DN9239_c0_g1_i11.p1  ORF type:complete len:112 (-),score=14.27 TRINITY_DN9239_c0_g1_i11:1493-1828(-)